MRLLRREQYAMQLPECGSSEVGDTCLCMPGRCRHTNASTEPIVQISKSSIN